MLGKAMCVTYFLRANKVKILAGATLVLYSKAAALIIRLAAATS